MFAVTDRLIDLESVPDVVLDVIHESLVDMYQPDEHSSLTANVFVTAPDCTFHPLSPPVIKGSLLVGW